MESHSASYDIVIKLAFSLLILSASVIFTASAWANKSSESGPKFNFKETLNLAHKARKHHRHRNRFRARFHWRGPAWGWGYPGWGYRPSYWGPWTPYWTGGVYCRKRCLVNRWGRVVRCRVNCY